MTTDKMKSEIYHLHAISSLHVGIGQGVGVIDMPIARERASNLPQVPGSGIKGVLRDELGDNNDKEKLALFGPKMGDNSSKYAGAIKVGDAKLLALPIRSWSGTFAWVTCPMILNRYKRDLESMNKSLDDIPLPSETKAIHAKDTKLKNGDKIYLEDLDLEIENKEDVEKTDKIAEQIAQAIFTDTDWQKMFKQRFLIVHDNVFDFLSETATEIRARIKIDEKTGTVKQGALWYEEYLPAETLLWGIVAVDKPKGEGTKTAEELFEDIPKETRLQIGGNATVGAGQVRWVLNNSGQGA